MRRKAGALLAIEIDILRAGIALLRGGDAEFHGYAVAREIANDDGARRLTAHGTLYRALERLETRGLVTSRWEDPAIAAQEERPRRRLYRITAEGERAAAAAPSPAPARPRRAARGVATS